MAVPISASECNSRLRDLIKETIQQTNACNFARYTLLYRFLSKYVSDEILRASLKQDDHLFEEHFEQVVTNVCGYPIHGQNLRRLELSFLAGFIELAQSGPVEAVGKCIDEWSQLVKKRLIHFLSYGCYDLHGFVISITERWCSWLFSTQCANEDIKFNVVKSFSELYSAVLLHWDSDDTSTVRQLRQFMAAIPSPAPVSPVDVTDVVYASILNAPLCEKGCVLLDKGAINILLPVLQRIEPSVILERSPFLVTSLLLALGHNYTAATAADALNLMLQSSTRGEIWLERVVTPVLRYILLEHLDCTTLQETLGSTTASIQTVRQNRRENFANHCLGRKFCTVSVETIPESIWNNAQSCCTPFESDFTLAEWLLRCLCSSHTSHPGVPASLVQHRLFIWLSLFAVHGDKTQLLQNKLDLSPLLTGLVHADDPIRSLALIGIANLGSTILSHKQLPNHLRLWGLAESLVELGHLFFVGVILLHSSSSPVARKALIFAFDEFVRSIRNACSSIRPVSTTGTDFHCLFALTNRGWLLDTALGSLTIVELPRDQSPETSWTRQSLALQWLSQLIDFQSHLWHRDSPTTNSSFTVPVAMFWPGMSYQRCKVFTELAYHAIGLCNFEQINEGGDLSGQWRTGYAPSSITNLRQLFRVLSSKFEWQFDALSTLDTMLRNLPVIKCDVQTQLLQLVHQNWPQLTHLSDPGSEQIVPHWLQQATHWSDSPFLAVYTAGANLLTFLITRGHLKNCKQVAPIDSTFRTKLERLCAAFTPGDNSQNQLLLTAQNETGLGYLLAMDQILGQLTNARSYTSISARFPDAFLSFLTSDSVVSACLELCNHCLSVMGCQAWSQANSSDNVTARKGASSFRELSQSVLRAALSGRLRDSGDGATDEPLVESIELLPEYQHILSWSWNTLCLCCNILAQWSAIKQQQLKQPQQEEQHGSGDNKISAPDNDSRARVGFQLLHVLLHCRHRGTVESVCTSLQLYLTAADSGAREYGNRDDGNSGFEMITCEQVLDVCWDVLCNYSYSVTRRAAGLWPAVKAALLAERARGTRRVPNLLICWLERLLRLAASPDVDRVSIPDEKADSPRALALHILRGLVADARLRAHIQSVSSANGKFTGLFVVEAIRQAVLSGFAAPDWTVSNAALQLYSALVLRLTGSSSGRPSPSAITVFNSHKPLLDVCMEHLEWVGVQDRSATWTTGQLLPLLTLITRMAPASGSGTPQAARLRACLVHILMHNTVAAIRQLAAFAYMVFLPLEKFPNSWDTENVACDSTTLSCAICLIASIGPWPLLHRCTCCSVRVPDSQAFGANAIHGQLCLLRAWYQQPIPVDLMRTRQSLFQWSVAFRVLNCLLFGPRAGPGTWFMAAQLCDLMTLIFGACDHPEWTTLRPTVEMWYSTNMERFINIASDRPFYPEAVVALSRFIDRVCPALLTNHPVNLSNWSQQLVLLLLGSLADTDSPQDTAVFATAAVRYWLVYDAMPIGHMLFSWRVVRVWACAIQDRMLGISNLGVTLLDGMNERALELLRQLLDAQNVGSADAANRASALLCEAVCLSATQIPKSTYLDHWFDHLTDCLRPNSLESARIVASNAVRVWLTGLMDHRSSSHNSDWPVLLQRLLQMLTVTQRYKFLSLLFRGVFDECVEVRHTVASCISLCAQTTIAADALPLIKSGLIASVGKPIAPLIAAVLLLERLLPAVFSDNYQAEITSWLRAEWIHSVTDLNKRLIEETMMRERHVLYEREADNDYCEPRLVLELITRTLHQQPLSDKQWMKVCEKLRSEADTHLSRLIGTNNLKSDWNEVCGLNRPVELLSAAQFARQLGLSRLCEPRRTDMHSHDPVPSDVISQP